MNLSLSNLFQRFTGASVVNKIAQPESPSKPPISVSAVSPAASHFEDEVTDPFYKIGGKVILQPTAAKFKAAYAALEQHAPAVSSRKVNPERRPWSPLEVPKFAPQLDYKTNPNVLRIGDQVCEIRDDGRAYPLEKSSASRGLSDGSQLNYSIYADVPGGRIVAYSVERPSATHARPQSWDELRQQDQKYFEDRVFEASFRGIRYDVLPFSRQIEPRGEIKFSASYDLNGDLVCNKPEGTILKNGDGVSLIVHDGVLRHFTSNGLARIQERDLESYLEQNRSRPVNNEAPTFTETAEDLLQFVVAAAVGVPIAIAGRVWSLFLDIFWGLFINPLADDGTVLIRGVRFANARDTWFNVGLFDYDKWQEYLWRLKDLDFAPLEDTVSDRVYLKLNPRDYDRVPGLPGDGHVDKVVAVLDRDKKIVLINALSENSPRSGNDPAYVDLVADNRAAYFLKRDGSLEKITDANTPVKPWRRAWYMLSDFIMGTFSQ